MKALPCGRDFQRGEPGWRSTHRRVINLTKRAVILFHFSMSTQGVRYMNMVIFMVLAAFGFCSTACACEGSVDDWSSRYLAMKTVRGHFDEGAWTASVDGWNGAKHQVMQCLAAHATAKAVTTATLMQWMGKPDDVVRCPSADCAAFALANERLAELWVYRWRGNHDRLGFVLVDGRVSTAEWAYVGE